MLNLKEIVNMPNLALQALALTICHLKQFGLERIVSLGSSFRPFSCQMEMTLSGNTLTQLEVISYVNILYLKKKHRNLSKPVF